MVKGGGSGRPAIYYFLWRNEFKLGTGSTLGIGIDPKLHKNIMKETRSAKKKLGSKLG